MIWTVIGLAAGLAPADPPACRAEPTEAGRAACLALAADLADHAMEAALLRVAAQVQGAGAGEPGAYAQEVMARQAAWRDAVRAACGTRGLDAARCRFRAAEHRAATVSALVAEAEARLGLADPYAGFEPYLEVLPGPGGRFRVTPRIDLPAPR